ncbi:hypothetical protein JFT81_07675 [Pseudomonas sp. TH43]|uniref:hypothetical protein n=1 Tax=Pseudomonas sp. TH43 TaxID=2796407 RepID=UPI001914BCE2|nr:hypothetical protein [Pseudomonas sp. TH43]MBK5374509.1 hypothetical protein [Pseudomonas sp. TH43]
MCTLTHFASHPVASSNSPFILHISNVNELPVPALNVQPPKFKVIPAGTAFFHIQETSTGRVRGFRKDHNQACALARSLELQIELLASDCLR